MCETADHTMPYRASTCFGNGEQTMTYCMLYGFVSFGGVRGNRYADERLVCLDVLLIGVNCCIFNGPDTPYYPLGTKFIAGALKVLKPKPAKEGGTSSSRKMQDLPATPRYLSVCANHRVLYVQSVRFA